MGYKLIVNIKEKEVYITTIEALYKSNHSVEYLFNHAIDKIQNYFHVYIKANEIFKGKFCNDTHLYWKVTPKGKKQHATIIIDKD